MMKYREKLNIGDKIDIIKTTSKIEENYSSQILDIIDDETFSISDPIYKNNLVIMHENENIKISYVVKDKGIYFFEAIVLKREYKGVYKLEIKKTSSIKKHQQRKYYRFKASIPVIKQFNIKDKEFIEECKTQNISGNGLKLYSNFEHNVGDIVCCKFKINNYKIIVNSRIMRVEKIDSFDYKNSLGVDFIELDEKDRDKIIQFIFLKQRLLREKELI